MCVGLYYHANGSGVSLGMTLFAGLGIYNIIGVIEICFFKCVGNRVDGIIILHCDFEGE